MSTSPGARPAPRRCSKASSSSSSASRPRTWPSVGDGTPLSSAATAEHQDQYAGANAIRQQVLDELKAALGGAVVGEHIQGGDLWIRVNASQWRSAAEACRSAGFVYFDFLSGLDWMPS